jgi:predicted amidophosphoribosyltransferase
MDNDYFYSLVLPRRRPKDKKRKCLKCLKMRDSTPEQRICAQCTLSFQYIGSRAGYAYPDPHRGVV